MQKVKLLKLYEFLRKETDADHPISRRTLCRTLIDMGISSNVRTLSKDIDTLRENGFDVKSYLREKERLYYVSERQITIPEIKIIIDAVQAAGFLTQNKSEELSGKIADLLSTYQAEQLKKNTVRFNTHKHTNESVLCNVERIEDAIARKKKITYNYFHLNEKAEREYVKTPTGRFKKYNVEPVALIYNNDNYYLMAYNSKHPEGTANYRIDRIDNIKVSEESTISKEAIAKIEGVAEFTGEAFKLFGGKTSNVVLRFSKELVEPVFDKFGEDTEIKKINKKACKAAVNVRVSPTFFGWLTQFGSKMKIVSPASVKEKYENHLKAILE